MKLITKEISKKAQAQYALGSELDENGYLGSINDGPVGPDVELERLGKMFEAVNRLKTVLPDKPITFHQFIEMQTPGRSNAWAYVSNRTKTTLISF